MFLSSILPPTICATGAGIPANDIVHQKDIESSVLNPIRLSDYRSQQVDQAGS